MNTPIKVTPIPVDRDIIEVLISLESSHIINVIIKVKITPKKIEAYGLVGVIQSNQLRNPIKFTPFYFIILHKM